MAKRAAQTSLDERLVESVERRRSMLERFGFVPMSILHLSRGPLHRSMFNLLSERPGGSMPGMTSTLHEELAKGEAGKATARARREKGLLGGVTSQKQSDRTSVSIMSAELVDFFVKYYAGPGAVYIDPFSAQGVQLQVAALRGLDYYGNDLCAEYVAYQRAMLPRLRTRTISAGLARTVGRAKGEIVVELHEGDSRDASWLPDGIGDFSFYSPPYWDIEFYGPEASSARGRRTKASSPACSRSRRRGCRSSSRERGSSSTSGTCVEIT